MRTERLFWEVSNMTGALGDATISQYADSSTIEVVSNDAETLESFEAWAELQGYKVKKLFGNSIGIRYSVGGF